MNDLLTTLRSGTVLLMDGAMGTELRRLRSTPLDCGERANLVDLPLVGEIHRSYRDAGAEVLLTNTFQANRPALARYGLPEQLHAIWHNALDVARSAKPRFVLADIGPMENATSATARELLAFAEDADGLLLETWTSFEDLARFAEVRNDKPMLVSFTFLRDAENRLVTFAKEPPEACARAATKLGLAAIGVNCGKEIGIADMIEIVGRFRAVCDVPTFVRPNAGTPMNGVYPLSPEEMAVEVPRLLEAGIAMIGGCCGTTPDHIWRIGLELNKKA